MLNLSAIQTRARNAELNMTVIDTRYVLTQDVPALVAEIQRLQRLLKNDPSGGEWQLETYTVKRKLANGEMVTYEYQREYRYEQGKKVMRHISTGRNTGRNRVRSSKNANGEMEMVYRGVKYE